MDDGADKIKEKSSNIEADKRREVIFEMLVKGFRRSQIIRYCADNFGIKDRQTDTYIQQVKEELAAKIEKNKDIELGLAIARYNDLFQKNYSIQDYRECRAVQDSLNKLFGINIERVDVTSGGEKITFHEEKTYQGTNNND